jgi:hypothetical protein
MDQSDDSRRFKNLFDQTSMMIMDELPDIEFFIINVKANPKSLEYFNVSKEDIPCYRFYSYTNEIPYTEHFWNKFRLANYFRERVLNKVKVIDSRQELEISMFLEESLIYLHNDSSMDHDNLNLTHLQSMACLYHKLKVFVVKDEGLFEFAKTIHPLKNNLDLRNKSHMIVYHSPHTGINMLGFNDNDFGYMDLRKFYREHRFAPILDYNRDVHDYLFIENVSAIFLVVKELHYRHRVKSLNWGKAYLSFRHLSNCQKNFLKLRKTKNILKWTTTNIDSRKIQFL